MTKDQIQTGKSPNIHLETCGGDLAIRGWAESIMKIKGDYGLQESEKGFRLSSPNSLIIHLPEAAILSGGKVNGDLTLKQFTGPSSFESVQGDAALSGVADTEIGIVHGDLVARKLQGTLSVKEILGDVSARGVGIVLFGVVHGDISARRIDGDLVIDSVDGDTDLRAIDGDVTIKQSHRDVNLAGVSGQVNITQVRGDIRLRGGLESGEHVLEAQGDIIIRWPAGMPLHIVASGNRIDNRLLFEDMTEEAGSLIGRIGEGSTNLTITTPGRIILKESEPSDEKWISYDGGEMEFDFGFDMAAIATKIETEVNRHLSRATRDFETKFGAEFGQGFAEKVAGKMEKAAERTRRRAEARGRASGFDFSSPPPAETKKSASTEEQLKILKMVETGKISPEEASMLLEALDA